ncbi:MAG: YadA-like family protein, partial [Campylobacter sp.]|nr:YadA-like family protein [Campylobacter sp.]
DNNSTITLVSYDENGEENSTRPVKITNLAPGEINATSTDAINGSQLYYAVEGNRTKVTVNGGKVAPTDGTYTDGNLKLTHGGENNNTYDLKLANNLVIGEVGDGTPGNPGEDGSIKVQGKDGKDAVSIDANATDGARIALGNDGKDGVTLASKDGEGSIGLNGKDGASATITVVKEVPGVNGQPTDKLDRIQYKDSNDDSHLVATLDDGLKFKGNYNRGNDPIAKKLNQQLDIVGTHTAGEANLTVGNIGVINDGSKLVIELAKHVDLTKDGNLSIGNTLVDNSGLTISNTDPDKIIKLTDNNVSMGGNQIHNVAAGTADTDAVNVSQLKNAAEGNKTKVTVNGGTVAPTDGTYTDGNLKLTHGGENNNTYDLKLANKLSLGDSAESGAVTVNNKNGKAGVEIFADDNTGEGHIKITNGKDGNDAVSADITVAKVDPAGSGQNGTTNTRITYKDASGNPETVATLNDGLKFKGDKGDVASKKLNETLNIKGNTAANAKLTEGNIGVENVGGDLIIKLAQNIDLGNDGSVKTGDTTINNDGLTIKNGPTITKNNVDMGGNQIHNVVAGVADTDAVNVSQLKATQTDITNVTNIVTGGKTNVDIVTYNVEGQTEHHNQSVIEAINSMNEQGIQFFHTNKTGVTVKPDKKNEIDSSAAGGYATAIGVKADASATNALAIGHEAVASGEQSIAIGNGAQASGKQSISVGTGNKVTGNNSGAFGNPNTISGSGSYAMGNNNTVSTNDTFVMGNNVTSTVADSLFLGSRTAYVGEGTRSKGTNNAYTSASVTAKNAAGENVVIGMKNFAGGNQVKGVVSVGNANETRRIQNVAPGLISKDSTDAINGSQLYSAIEGIAEHLGNNITNINQRIDNVRDEARAGVASAIAIGNLPQSTIPGKGMLSVGTGYYQDEGALSIGLSKMSDNGKWVFKSSISVDTQDNIGAGASLGFHF